MLRTLHNTYYTVVSLVVTATGAAVALWLGTLFVQGVLF